MAASSLFTIALTLFFTLHTHTSYAKCHHTKHPPSLKPSKLILQACNATRYPLLCHSTLQPSTTPLNLTTTAISLTLPNIKKAKSLVTHILTLSTSNKNRTRACKTCLQSLNYAETRTNNVLNAVFNKNGIKDSRAWLSAVLNYEYSCWSSLKYVNGTAEVNETMAFLNTLQQLTSNALSLLVAYDVYGNDVASWRAPRTERDGFWEHVSDASFRTVSFPIFKTSVTVCKEKRAGCDYVKIQDAVNAAPDNKMTPFVIRIKGGVYNEIVRVPYEKKNVVMIGDGMGKTVITGNLNVGILGLSTNETPTLGVDGDGFIMKGVTVKNTAGAGAHQAVAFMSASDQSYIQDCEFIGNQDTLYPVSLRQIYKNCRIVGNVDFIFGNSAAIFQDCEILIAPRQLEPEKGDKNAITAHGRTDPAQSTGFVFINCVINGTKEYLKYYKSKPEKHKTYLGRPWKEYSRTVFIKNVIDKIVVAEGWLPWKEDFALKTLYYGEFGNTGAGADLSKRVEWSSKIPKEHVASYSANNFVQAADWKRLVIKLQFEKLQVHSNNCNCSVD